MIGAFFETKWAASAQNFGLKPIRITSTEFQGDLMDVAEAELLSIRLIDGAQIWDDVKSSLAKFVDPDPLKVQAAENQAKRFVTVALANNRIPRYVVYNIPSVTCTVFTTLVNFGLEIVNGNTGVTLRASDVCP